MPILKISYISISGISPYFCKQPNIGRIGHEPSLICAAIDSGNIRGIFSTNPPPVICAAPFIFFSLISGSKEET